ncbi:Cytochrome P450 71A1 like [Actinidia chinensis var. chinensis]|uniref:Cytochrome P450 71A1 like n=1 Tax=Actinidia chinensis var. chinensis TaxID=1590841 RepID=A0A2R6QCM7_ACTCC|nr:Cytochrome P450 71A1 like [Actinidia chinensis var. chinensis]
MALIPHLLQYFQELYRTTLINPFLFSLLLLCFLFWLSKGGSKLNLPPSPPRLPIIGHLHLMGTLYHRSLYALSKTYGHIFLLYVGRAPLLVVTSEKIAKEIMTTQDIVFANRVRTRAVETLLYGCCDIAFAPYGEHWRQMRRICVSQLLSLKRVQSFRFVIEEEAAKLIEKICCASLDGALVNLGEMLVHTSSIIVFRCVIGRNYEGENMKRFEELSRDGVELVGGICFRDIFPSFGWVDVLTGKVKRLKDISKEVDDLLDKEIESYKCSKGNDDRSNSFAEILLQLQKEGIETDFTQDKLKATLMDMFVAATDTSSTTMEWALTELMKNPNEMKKTQEEVRRVVGKKSKVDQDDIDQMAYLKCVVKETLRLHAPVPFLIPRQLTESAKLEGYDIPPKTIVYINAWAIQRDSKLWDRPEEFLPERFANNPVDFRGQDFHFIPFGAGRRGCPGISFAVMQTEYVLSNLLYWFDWKFPGSASREDLDMNEVFGLNIHKKIPLQLVPMLHSFESLK